MTRTYAGQKQSVFEEMTSARATMLAARTPDEIIAADATLRIVLARLLLLQEVHPELKSDPAFPRRQASLRTPKTASLPPGRSTTKRSRNMTRRSRLSQRMSRRHCSDF